MRSSLSLLALAGMMAAEACIAEAFPIRFDLSGPVTFVAPGGLGDTFNTSQTFSASYTFDAEARDLAPDDPSFGQYDAIVALSVRVGDYSLTLADSGQRSIFVENGSPDRYTVEAAVTGPNAGQFAPLRFQLFFLDPSGTALTNDALPRFAADVFSGFGVSFWDVQFQILGGRDIFAVGGDITSLRTFVPEPTALVLLGSGLAGLGIRAWRRHRG
jgi:hypothetical protein